MNWPVKLGLALGSVAVAGCYSAPPPPRHVVEQVKSSIPMAELSSATDTSLTGHRRPTKSKLFRCDRTTARCGCAATGSAAATAGIRSGTLAVDPSGTAANVPAPNASGGGRGAAAAHPTPHHTVAPEQLRLRRAAVGPSNDVSVALDNSAIGIDDFTLDHVTRRRRASRQPNPTRVQALPAIHTSVLRPGGNRSLDSIGKTRQPLGGVAPSARSNLDGTRARSIGPGVRRSVDMEHFARLHGSLSDIQSTGERSQQIGQGDPGFHPRRRREDKVDSVAEGEVQARWRSM